MTLTNTPSEKSFATAKSSASLLSSTASLPSSHLLHTDTEFGSGSNHSHHSTHSITGAGGASFPTAGFATAMVEPSNAAIEFGEDRNFLSQIDEELSPPRPSGALDANNNNSTTLVLQEQQRKQPPPEQQQQQQAPCPASVSKNLSPLALLPEDTFSLLVFSREWVTVVFAIVTMSFQLATLGILIADVINIQATIQDDPKGYQPNNPLGIPAAVNAEVLIAQLFALITSLLSENDILWSIHIQINGYHPELVTHTLLVGQWTDKDDSEKRTFRQEEVEKLVPIEEPSTNSHTTTFLDDHHDPTQPQLQEQQRVPPNLHRRWQISYVARFLVGCMSLSATFMLIVRSETVLDILLNFTAIEFISQIDNCVFALAKWGYFGDKIRHDAKHRICNNGDFAILNTFRCSPDWHFAWNTLLRVGLAILLVGCWAWVVAGQNNGRYLSREIYVQMGDSSDFNLGTYSGVYVRIDRRRRRRRESRRFAWVAKFGPGELTYCSSEGSWIFRDLDNKYQTDNPCGWIIKSPESESYDVLATDGADWIIQDDFNVQVPAEKMLLVSHNSVNKPKGVCAANTDTSTTTAYGLNCEFQNVCPLLSIDARRVPFTGDRSIPDKFTLVENLEVYDRPVYFGRVNDEAVHVLLYTGRRWVLASTLSWIPDGVLEPDGVAAMLQGFRVQTFPVLLGALFISTPVDVGTSNNAATPENIEWFDAEVEQSSDIGRLVNIDTGFEVTTKLVCSSCDEDNPCLFDAPCVNNRCECDVGAKGTRCEVPPTNNGFCNSRFNDKRFNYDSGDCCMFSCVNTPRFACGKTAKGYNDVRNVECGLPLDVVGWRKVVESVTSSGAAGFGGAVAMAGEGSTVWVGAPDTDNNNGLISVLRQNGSEWVSEIADLSIEFRNERFGERIIYAETVPNSVSNPDLLRNGLMAGFGDIDGFSYLYPYSCRSGECSAIPIFGILPIDVFGQETAPPGNGLFYFSVTDIPRQNFTSFPFFGYPTFTQVDITLPGAISADGRYLCVGGDKLTMLEFDEDENAWYLVFFIYFRGNGDGDDAVVRYVDIARVPGTNDEYFISLGLKRRNPMESRARAFDESPLEVRVYRWVKGTEPEQLGTEAVSDYHIVDDLEAQPVEGQPRNKIPLMDSVILSADGTSMVWSSFFLTDGTQLVGRNDQQPDTDPTAEKVNATDVEVPGPGEFGRVLQAVVLVAGWNGTEWVPRDKLVLGERVDRALQHGWVTRISADGLILAIATSMDVRIYRWNETAYVEEYLIENEQLELPSISLSGDGSALAIGNPTRGLSGTFDVYQDINYTPCSDRSTTNLMHLSFTTGESTASTFWRVTGRNNETLREGGPYGLESSIDLPSNATFVFKECFAVEECSSMSVTATSTSASDEGTFVAYFARNEIGPTVGANCELVLYWSGP